MSAMIHDLLPAAYMYETQTLADAVIRGETHSDHRWAAHGLSPCCEESMPYLLLIVS